MPNKPKVTIFTYIPSPYQVELFNAVAREEKDFSLSVFYIYSRLHAHLAEHSSVAGFWRDPPIEHEHLMLDDEGKKRKKAEYAAKSADLAVFSYYRHPFVAGLAEQYVENGKKWCFWGERPGYNRLGQVGFIYRRWKLRNLYKQNVPIWGIGGWAVNGYRKEFGERRKYFNMPYFSDLASFAQVEQEERLKCKERVFLFSGSLIYRKGVDLLAYAFSELADEFPHVRLNLMGEGKLRLWLEKKLVRHRDKIRFLGFQPWTKLPFFYKSSHFLCAPSRYDGWAVAVPEGLAAGLPVISTERTGAALEFIKNGKNGWIIPAGNKEVLHRVMRRAAMLSSDELSQRSRNAREGVSNHSLRDGVRRFHDAVMGTLDS